MFVAIGGNVKERTSFFVVYCSVRIFGNHQFWHVTWNSIPSYCTSAQSLQDQKMYRM